MLIGHLGIEPTGPTAGMYRQMTQPYKGGITSFMAGMFDSVFGGADLSMDLACGLCAVDGGGHSAEDWYKQWLAAHHIPTGDDSWYGAGIGSADVISLLLGGGAAEGGASVAGADTALSENEIGSTVENIMSDAEPYKYRKTLQLTREGGFDQANSDFDELSQGVDVVDRPDDVRTATLGNGTRINVRPTSSGKMPTLEIVTPGNPAIKIRYP